MVFQLCGVKILVSNNELVCFNVLYSSPLDIKYLFSADEDWKEDPGEEAVRCPDEADVLRSVCGGRGERFLYIKNSQINISLNLSERPGHRPHHRQNEELRSEEHPGLQRRGGPLPGGRRGHRDGVSSWWW